MGAHTSGNGLRTVRPFSGMGWGWKDTEPSGLGGKPSQRRYQSINRSGSDDLKKIPPTPSIFNHLLPPFSALRLLLMETASLTGYSGLGRETRPPSPHQVLSRRPARPGQNPRSGQI